MQNIKAGDTIKVQGKYILVTKILSKIGDEIEFSFTEITRDTYNFCKGA